MAWQPSGGEGDLLLRIRDGMAVFDRDDEPVGTVTRLYLGGQGPVEAARQTGGAGALGVADSPLAEVSAEVRGRLAREGFVWIAPGPLEPDRYATGGQVAAVEGDCVRLNVRARELVTG